MKPMYAKVVTALAAVFLSAGSIHAEPPAQPDLTVEPPVKFAVMIPEQIDGKWYWIYHTDERRHLVQSQVEKQLIRAGLNVIDLQTASASEMIPSDALNDAGKAADAARKLGADYLITGKATAVNAMHSRAYGVNVYRSSADITLRIIRLKDSQIIDVFDATAREGGESWRKAGQEALKTAAKEVAPKAARAAVRTLEQTE